MYNEARCHGAGFTESAAAAHFATDEDVVEHIVQPVRNVCRVQVSEKNTFFHATAMTGGFPPRRRRRPRRSITSVEGSDGREEMVGEGPRHKRKLIRHGPVRPGTGVVGASIFFRAGKYTKFICWQVIQKFFARKLGKLGKVFARFVHVDCAGDPSIL